MLPEIEGYAPNFMPLPEQIRMASSIGIVLEDDDFMFKQWSDCFEKVPGFLLLKINPVKEGSEWIYGLNSFEEAGGYEKVVIVISDQFYDCSEEVVHYINIFLNFLREKNPKALVVEESYAPNIEEGNPYFRDVLLHSDGEEYVEAIKLFHQSLVSSPCLVKKGEYLELLRRAFNIGFIESGLVEKDSNNSYHYFLKFMDQPDSSRVLDILDLRSMEEYEEIYKDLEYEQRWLFMHLSFKLLGHLQMGDSEDFYSMAQSRLLVLLSKNQSEE